MKQAEYKEIITLKEVKTGEIIRTEFNEYYLVIKTPHAPKPRYLRVDPAKPQLEITGEITTVFKPNGIARIQTIIKEDEEDENI